MTRVLPEPGPARIRLNPSGAVAASRWASFRSVANRSRSRSVAVFWSLIFRMPGSLGPTGCAAWQDDAGPLSGVRPARSTRVGRAHPLQDRELMRERVLRVGGARLPMHDLPAGRVEQ